MTTLQHPKITRAIVPAAGYGTRLRPLSLAIPKEMLPLGRKPLLEHVVEELKGAGITEILLVVSPGKEMIRRYFGDGDAFGVKIDFEVQPSMRGLGDAILRGEYWTRQEPFLVAFGDCLVTSGEFDSPSSRLSDVFSSQGAQAAVLTEQVAPEKTTRYGILRPFAPQEEWFSAPFPFSDIVEKPAPTVAPSRCAVAARWALSHDIFEFLRDEPPGPDGEVTLTDPVRKMLQGSGAGWGVPLQKGEARLDIGGWDTYLHAAARFACADAEFGSAVRQNLLEEPSST